MKHSRVGSVDGEAEANLPLVLPTYIVGIGASAGGLEPIELFFDSMPTDSGLAFVVVQHLSPDFKSLMQELLARRTEMRIHRVSGRCPIEADCVYLIPPRKTMIVLDGHLLIHDQDREEQPHLPIDAFLSSLAADSGDRAVAVVLSGSGTDGARGAAAVRAAGGLVIAQAPKTAGFPSMPEAVIDAGVATAVAAPGEIPDLIVKHAQGVDLVDHTDLTTSPLLEPIKRILVALRQRFGPDFGYYKQSTVSRRIERRMGLKKFATIEDYADFVVHNTQELETMYHDLLIGVTSFFRDRPAFDVFAEKVLPDLVDRMAGGEQVRVWVAGCATGEEVYSIVILFAEAVAARNLQLNLKVFATDVHDRSLAAAAEGVYGPDALEAVSPERLEAYFDEVADGNYRIKPSIRRFIVFSQHNLIKDPPFSRLHLISCRNLLIYLGEAAQRKVLALFHFSLRKQGILFLGSSETVARMGDEFLPISTRYRLFRKARDVRLPSAMNILPPSTGPDLMEMPSRGLGHSSWSGGQAAIQRHLLPAYDALLAAHAPPGLLVDAKAEIVHVFGEAAAFLRPIGEGPVSLRAADRVRPELRMAVTTLIEHGLRRAKPSVANDIALVGVDGAPERVRVKSLLLPRDERDYPEFLFISFELQRTDPAVEAKGLQYTPTRSDGSVLATRVRELETDLRFTEENLQTTIEELETSNEELQASNEELQASNEELQSTNEELYSVNEELHTVSQEYEQRIEELVRLNADINNLLTSTEIGAIFLDQHLNLRRFTPAAAALFNLLDHDVGRPISHLTTRIVGANLQSDILAVRDGASRVEREVTTEGGGHHLVRILPYRDAEGHIDGVNLSFVDIGPLKEARLALEERAAELAAANEELERFTYIASHDLKAPVRGCSHILHFLREDLADRLQPAEAEQLDIASDRLQRMETMLTELLAYARIGLRDGGAEAVDVEALIRETLGLIDIPPEFTVDVERPLPEVVTVPAVMSLVVRNLIANAVSHHEASPGGLVVSGKVDHGTVEFFFSDDGPGIPGEKQIEVFEPFRKLNPSSPGTGMGLAFVKRAIERVGGKIDIVQSAPGRGTTFRVRVPKVEIAVEVG